MTKVEAAVPVDVVLGEGGGVVEGLTVRQALPSGGAVHDPGPRLVAERPAPVVDENLDVAAREAEGVGVDVVVAGVHQQQVLVPVVVDVEVGQPGDRGEAPEEPRGRQVDPVPEVARAVVHDSRDRAHHQRTERPQKSCPGPETSVVISSKLTSSSSQTSFNSNPDDSGPARAELGDQGVHASHNGVVEEDRQADTTGVFGHV